HPSHLQSHAELLCQRLAELELEASLIAVLARERQRVRIGANHQPAPLFDRIERTRGGGGCHGNGDERHRRKHADEKTWLAFADHHGLLSGLRLRIYKRSAWMSASVSASPNAGILPGEPTAMRLMMNSS